MGGRSGPGTAARPRTRFQRPGELAAVQPPEARGLERDGVRLLAARGTRIEHARFRDLHRFLDAGDLLVVNTSATRPSAVDGRVGGEPAVVHFSTRLDDGSWVVEVRTAPDGGAPVRTLSPGTTVELPTDLRLVLLTGHPVDQGPAGPRLWRTQPLPPGRVGRLLRAAGRPIRYSYLSGRYRLEAYQTVFADPGTEPESDEAASAEMPSAGRPFSHRLVTRLVSQGVQVAPIVLHAGVSSAEAGEPPASERFRVPARTAALVNRTRAEGQRVIAVGTTVTRALESALESAGGSRVRPADGWTDLVLGPDQPVRVVDGLVTGLHDPGASHLLLLEAVAGAEQVQQVYDAALERRYLWHEFGDSCLLLG